jgi:hypothetical protein
LVVGHGSRRAPVAFTAATSGEPLGYDVQDVSVTYPEPLVPLDTIKYDGTTPGVQVGNSFYAAPPGQLGSSALQVLFFDRNDLGYEGYWAPPPRAHQQQF